MAYYTAVLFAHNWFAHRGTYTISREVQTCGLRDIVELLTSEGKIDRKHIDTIVLLKNGKVSPEVVQVWSSKSGHFQTEEEKRMNDLALHIEVCMSPAEKKLFLDTFCANNPHYRGAHVSDILSMLYDTDSHIDKTDNVMYEAHRQEIEKYPRGLFSLCVFVAIYTKLGPEWEVIQHLLKRFNKK